MPEVSGPTHRSLSVACTATSGSAPDFNIDSLHYNCWKSDHGVGKKHGDPGAATTGPFITRMFHSPTSMELSLPDIFGGKPLARIELTK